MKYSACKEGRITFYAPVNSVISKDLPVFYNPAMEYNRTMSIAVLNALNRKDMQIADPLAGSGIRAIRFLKEVNKGIIKKIHINDYSKEAIKLIKKNIKNNKIKSRYEIFCEDANLFLLTGHGFDYIDLDPFGSPNKFLNNAIERLSRDGILAVTATDTAVLCGTFKDTCERKYWAKPSHTNEMHEIGLRILIRKVQLMGMHFEKALMPILSYSKDHYMRVFFLCDKGRKKSIPIFEKQGMYNNAGPMWLGQLHNSEFIKKIELNDLFTEIIKQEIDVLGHYEIPDIVSKEKLKKHKKILELISEIKKKGYKASRTQFSMQGVKTDMPYKELLQVMQA